MLVFNGFGWFLVGFWVVSVGFQLVFGWFRVTLDGFYWFRVVFGMGLMVFIGYAGFCWVFVASMVGFRWFLLVFSWFLAGWLAGWRAGWLAGWLAASW